MTCSYIQVVREFIRKKCSFCLTSEVSADTQWATNSPKSLKGGQDEKNEEKDEYDETQDDKCSMSDRNSKSLNILTSTRIYDEDAPEEFNDSNNPDFRCSRVQTVPFLSCVSSSKSPLYHSPMQSTHFFSPPSCNLSASNPGQPALRRVPSVSDSDLTMPEMSQRSSVLSQHQVSTLFLSFPPRLRLYPWHLLFSISRNGCSLANLYSKLENYDSTLLLLILDTKRTAFGALLSPPNIKLQGKKYSGTPETFLFTFSPKLRKFAASGENNYFIQCMPDGLSIGGWRAGIWIDNNLEKGTTDVSPTFENTALTDTNFVIKEMECWALSEMEMESGYEASVPIYHQFSSSLLASKKPELEVGGVRCGRRSKKYQPTWVPEKGGAVYDNKRIFSLGEEEEDEGVEDEYDEDATPTSSRGWSSMYY